MNTTISRAILLGLVASAITGLNIATEAQAQEAFYYVDNQRITLSASEKYTAFALKSGISAASRQSLEDDVKKSGVVEIEKVSILEKRGILLFRPKPNIGPAAFRSGMTAFRARTEIGAPVPVFRFGRVNAVLINEFSVQFKAGATESSINEFIQNNNAEIIKEYTKIENRYILTFEGKTSQEALALSNSIHESGQVLWIEPVLLQIIPSRPEVRGSAPAPRAPSRTTAPSPAATTPTDPLYPQQWGLNNTGSGGVGLAGADIGAPEAWDLQTGSNQIIVAIVDEGTDTQHPDLMSKIVTPYDATDGDNNQDPNSWDGHGTACAGIAAAVTNTPVGIAGVAWNVKILPVRIALSSCNGCDWITSSAIIEDGLRTAVDRGAHVLSNSWGGGTPSNAINSGIDYAIANNRVVVIAAGNDSGPVSYPASLSSSKTIITVSATNEWDEFKTTSSQDGEFWWGSNFGPEVSIAAPGVHIYTTDIAGQDGYVAGDYVATFNGTSSATPFVAGAAALLLSQDPSLNPAQVRDLLQNSADDRGAPGFDHQFGHGRLNIASALEAIVDDEPPIQSAVSACSLCYTCGGDWPKFGGAIPTRKNAKPYERGNSCTGDLIPRSDNGPYLCCR